MSLVTAKGGGEPCKLCQSMRKSVYLIAGSTIVPIVAFMCLVMGMDMTGMAPANRETRDHILESAVGFLRLQLLIASAILIASVIRKHGAVHYCILYFIIHLILMTLFFILCMQLTFINGSYVLLGLVAWISVIYIYCISSFLKKVKLKLVA